MVACMQKVYWVPFLRSTCADHMHKGVKEGGAELPRSCDRGPLSHGELWS